MERDLKKEFVSKHEVMNLFGWETFASNYLYNLLRDDKVDKETKDFIQSEKCQQVIKREVFTEDDIEFNAYNTEKYLERTIDLVMSRVADRIRELPSKDMSPVIRCGNCWYSKLNKETKGLECTKWNHPCTSDHFCASGRHKMPRI